MGCFLNHVLGTGSLVIGICIIRFVSSYYCPNECECRYHDTIPGSVIATCYFRVLNADQFSYNFSVLSPENTTYLYVKCHEDRGRSRLVDNLFKDLYKLKKLIFETCHFPYIPEKAFVGLNNLENLTIYSATDLTIHPKAFVDLSNLKCLRIVRSGLQKLPTDALCPLKKLLVLDLEMNRIQNISEILDVCLRSQSVLSNIDILKLNQNNLRVIPSRFGDHFKQLRVIHLQDNRIESIQTGAFANFAELEIVDISNNSLSSLPDDFLDQSYNIFYYSISNNPIIEMPNSFGNLSNLTIFYADNTKLDDRIWNLLDKKSLLHLHLQNCSLNSIPIFISGLNLLMSLNIRQNNISEILPNSFRDCNNLQVLDLSKNRIVSLPKSFSKGLEKLIWLSLFQNQISNIDNETFLYAPNLSNLNLSSNLLKEIPPIPPTLQMLDLTKNEITGLSLWISPGDSSNLAYLILGKNRIKTIKRKAFSHFKNLLLLNLKENNIAYIDRYAFRGSEMLQGLNIAHNNIKELRGSLINLRSLQILYCQYNQISSLDKDTFPKKLSTINLSHNSISKLGNDIFYHMNMLSKIDLTFNQISSLSYMNIRLSKDKKYIPELYLLGNRLKCDCKLTWLKRIGGTSMHMSSMFPYIPDLLSTQCVKYNSSWLLTKSFDLVSEDKFLCEYERVSAAGAVYYCEIKCPCCPSKSCNCTHYCPEECLCLLSDDRTINKVECPNKVEHPNANFTNLKSLPSQATTIDLSWNHLGYLSRNSFTNHKAAVILNLNHSRISGIGNNTFITFRNLQKLYLNNNIIKTLQLESFIGLNSLVVLVLRYNNIEYIPLKTFLNVPKLEHLDLRDNKLLTLDGKMFSNAAALKKLFLTHNPWSCKCKDIYQLIKILTKNTDILDAGEEMFCNGNESSISVFQFEEQCRNSSNITTILRKVTEENIELISGLSIAGSLIFLISLVTGLIFVYRKELQIILFVHFGWRFMSKKMEIDLENKEYDAFVSFHNSQDHFVVHEMLPHLEQTEPSYKLCVHFRDFAVGAPISENIIESIENSKRTILLLTEKFLKSEWCKYEFQTAHYEGLSKRMNTLIVVLLEDINEDMLDSDFKLHLKTKSYLKYDDPWFWDKLRFVLPIKSEIKK